MLDFKKNNIQSQQLIVPIELDLDPIESEILSKHLTKINKQGFSIDSFGKNFFRILGIPNWLHSDDSKTFIEDLINHLRTRSTYIKNPEKIFSWESLAKLAIKDYNFSRKDDSAIVLNKIPQNLMNCNEPLINPFGKNTFFEISWSDINKKIK